jgi:hypothetical protein
MIENILESVPTGCLLGRRTIWTGTVKDWAVVQLALLL